MRPETSLDVSPVPDDATPPAPGTRRAAKARRATLLIALVALAFFVRAALAARLDHLPSDGAFFLDAARRFEAGEAARHDPINVYPIVLAALHRLGLDWFLAAKAWGVVAAALVVPPLFGWIRREFDESIAFVACLLYAVHPKLIEWSPEPIRDATFWWAMVACVYFGRRAARRATPASFAAAGLSWAVAVHTRFEGWFLAIPLAIWSLNAWRSRPERRGRVARGALVGLATFPAFCVAMNALWPGDEWRVGNASQVGLALKWLGLPTAGDASPRPPGKPEHRTLSFDLRVSPDAAETTRHKLKDGAASFLVVKMIKGFGALHGLLFLTGVAIAWRRWLELDQAALLPVVALTLGGMTLMLWYRGDASSRYVATATILALPYAAIGALSWAAWSAKGLERAWTTVGSDPMRLGSSRPTRAIVGVVLALGLTTIGLVDALSIDHADRAVWAELGRRLGAAVGPHATLLNCGPRQIAFYAEADVVHAQPSALAFEVASRAPRVVVVNRGELTAAEWTRLAAALRETGFASEPRFAVRRGVDDVRIYVRDDPPRHAGRVAPKRTLR